MYTYNVCVHTCVCMHTMYIYTEVRQNCNSHMPLTLLGALQFTKLSRASHLILPPPKEGGRAPDNPLYKGGSQDSRR